MNPHSRPSNRKKKFRRLTIVFLVTIFVSGVMTRLGDAQTPTGPPGIKTDFGIYPEGPLPALPAAGGILIDPVFGTQIMRITDPQDGTFLGNYYSYWPTFNKDNTRLLVRNGGIAFIRRFDPVTFTLGPKEEIPSVPGVGNPVFEGATWSGTDPNVLMLTANAALYAYHADTRTYELLADMSASMPGEYIKQPSWSRDGNRIGFTRKRFADYSEPGYAVYDRSQRRLILNVNVPQLDEVTISQSGKYLLAKLTQGVGTIESMVHDLDTGAQTGLMDDADHAPGHGDAGLDVYSGYDNWGNAINWRNLATPHEYRAILTLPSWGLGVGHTSMRADDESWVVQSFFGGAELIAFHNEVIQIATDGSQRVRRLFHHRGVFHDYYDSPRANISPDGRFIAFTSNWGGQPRTDLFVAKIEPASSSIPTPTPTPVPIPTPSPTPAPDLGSSVGKAKRAGQNLSNQLASTGDIRIAITSSSPTPFEVFIADIRNASADFDTLRASFSRAEQIALELTRAMASAIAANTAAINGDLATLKTQLRQAIDYLALANVLISYPEANNPIDVPLYMVRQNYLDFLNREPDEAGANFWTGDITACGANTQCNQVKRVNVSAAFFLSIEFIETGYYVYRLYKSSYGRFPSMAEFMPDTVAMSRGVIVGTDGWVEKLTANKQQFLVEWMQRPEFQSQYGGLTNAQFVDALIAKLGVTVSLDERNALMLSLSNGTSRAVVLEQLSRTPAFSEKEINSAFVLMQYFGYLRRDPDAAGFNFWLSKLDQAGGNYQKAEMVRAFLESIEYRERFRF